MLTLVLFGFMIAQFYSGSIISSILDTKHESIKTLHDLLKSPLKLAMENVPYDIYIFNVRLIYFSKYQKAYAGVNMILCCHLNSIFPLPRLFYGTLHSQKLFAAYKKLLFLYEYLITFQNTKDPFLKRIYHEKIINYNKKSGITESNIFQPDYGVKLIQGGAYAFHVQESTAYGIISRTFDEKSICKLSEIEAYRPSRLVVSLQKNSSFRELYTYG